MTAPRETTTYEKIILLSREIDVAIACCERAIEEAGLGTPRAEAAQQLLAAHYAAATAWMVEVALPSIDGSEALLAEIMGAEKVEKSKSRARSAVSTGPPAKKSASLKRRGKGDESVEEEDDEEDDEEGEEIESVGTGRVKKSRARSAASTAPPARKSSSSKGRGKVAASVDEKADEEDEEMDGEGEYVATAGGKRSRARSTASTAPPAKKSASSKRKEKVAASVEEEADEEDEEMEGEGKYVGTGRGKKPRARSAASTGPPAKKSASAKGRGKGDEIVEEGSDEEEEEESDEEDREGGQDDEEREEAVGESAPDVGVDGDEDDEDDDEFMRLMSAIEADLDVRSPLSPSRHRAMAPPTRPSSRTTLPTSARAMRVLRDSREGKAKGSLRSLKQSIPGGEKEGVQSARRGSSQGGGASKGVGRESNRQDASRGRAKPSTIGKQRAKTRFAPPVANGRQDEDGDTQMEESGSRGSPMSEVSDVPVANISKAGRKGVSPPKVSGSSAPKMPARSAPSVVEGWANRVDQAVRSGATKDLAKVFDYMDEVDGQGEVADWETWLKVRPLPQPSDLDDDGNQAWRLSQRMKERFRKHGVRLPNWL